MQIANVLSAPPAIRTLNTRIPVSRYWDSLVISGPSPTPMSPVHNPTHNPYPMRSRSTSCLSCPHVRTMHTVSAQNLVLTP